MGQKEDNYITSQQLYCVSYPSIVPCCPMMPPAYCVELDIRVRPIKLNGSGFAELM